MIALRAELKVVVCSQPIDFRRGINGLSALVAEALAEDPYCGNVFIFRSKRKDRLKLLAWDGSGMVLVSKWLESGGFTWPPITAGKVEISPEQMAVFVAGLDWTRVACKAVRRPTKTG
jgi:transposase